MERLHKFKCHSIGSRPCEQGLGEILERLESPFATRSTMKRLNKFKFGLNLFKDLFEKEKEENKSFLLNLLALWKTQFYTEWKIRYESGKVPKDVYTFLLCCMDSYHKELIQSLNLPGHQQRKEK